MSLLLRVRSKNTLALPLLLVGGVALAALSPALFQGKIPAETNLLQQFGPWAPLPYKGHPIMSGGDSFFAYLPDRLFAVEEWKAGRVPLWNPYISGGVPILGGQTAGPLDPLLVLHLVLPTSLALGLGYAILLFMAGLGMALFLRQRGIREGPALAAGTIAFALNPYFIYWLELRVFVAGLALVPLSLWALEGLTERAAHRPWAKASVLALTVGYAALAGTLQTLALVLFILLARWLWLYFEHRETPAFRGTGAAAVAVGLGIGCLPVVAGIELLGQSTRVGTSSGYYATSNFLPWQAMTLWFSPDAFGWPNYRLQEVLPVMNRSIAASSGWGALGIVVLYLALGALVLRIGPARERRFWGLIALLPLMFLFLLKTPLHGVLSRAWPGIDHIDLLRTLFLVNLAGAVLAGWGACGLFQAWRTGALRPWRRLLAAYGVFGFLILIAGRASIDPAHGLAHDLAPLAITLLILAALLFSSVRLAWVLPCLIAFELGRLHFQFNTFGPAHTDFPPRPLITEMQTLLGPPRHARFYVPSTCRALPPNTASLFRLADIRGYSTLPLARYRKLLEAAEGVPMNNRSYIERPVSQVYRLLGGAFVLIYTGGEMIGPMFQVHPLSGAEDRGFFSRLDAMPRAFLMHEGVVLPDETLTETLGNLGFDPGSMLVADAAAEPLPRMEPALREESVAILQYEPDKIVLQAELSAPATLVLTDAFYPGWNARADGRPTRIFPVYWGLRGIGVNAGSHSVVFEYRPWWLIPGGILTLACLLVAAAGLVLKRKANSARAALHALP